jgi:hypothetical protein
MRLLLRKEGLESEMESKINQAVSRLYKFQAAETRQTHLSWASSSLHKAILHTKVI